MPYHKNKQQAFQAAQQGFNQAKDVYDNLDPHSPEYGHYVKRLKQEINEAEQQIENALEVAGEIQKEQLQHFQEELNTISQTIEEH